MDSQLQLQYLAKIINYRSSTSRTLLDRIVELVELGLQEEKRINLELEKEKKSELNYVLDKLNLTNEDFDILMKYIN